MAPTGFIQRVLRALDIFIALCVLAVGLPVLVIVAVAIKLDDGGSVFFRQTRVGKSGQRFSIFKFRTMTEDKSRFSGDAVGAGVSSDARAQFQTTVPNDSRITRVGKVLRPTHLDELPQILNVLSGDMSFVGVRPDVPVQEADYTPDEWRQRNLLRPGITGWAQIDSTVDNTEKRTKRDLYWVNNASVGLYFRILFATFAKVLKRNSL